MPDIAFLFCSDYFDKAQPDIDYAEEYHHAKNLGIPAHLFCLETFLESNKLRIAHADKPVTLIYRGWMVTHEQYTALYDSLLAKGFTLINTPEQYRQCHHLPYWYGLLVKHTAKSLWTQGVPSEAETIQLLMSFGDRPLIVKDYVKSRKHEWEEACFIPNASDTDDAAQVIDSFLERQGDDLAGGIVLREYLSLKMLGSHKKSHMPIAKEVRIFCIYHQPFAYIQYWSGEESRAHSEYQSLISACRGLDSNFYTIDLAQQENGEWIIIEVGDGQVSGLQDYNVALFYSALLNANTNK